MGSAFLAFPVFPEDPLHRHLHVPAVGLHDLNGLSHGKLVLLLDPPKAASIRFLHSPQIGIVFHICAAVIDLGVASRLSEIKARGKFPVGAFSDLLPVPLQIFPVFLRTFQIIIDGLPVCPGHGGHIQGRFHAPLDLKAVDAGFDHLRNVLDHTEILGVKNKGSPVVFIDRHVFAGPGLLHH